MNSWALYQQNGSLLVGKLISPGVRTFATVDRTGSAQRINRVYVAGLFDTEEAAFTARDAARNAPDCGAAKAAIKATPGYRPLP